MGDVKMIKLKSTKSRLLTATGLMVAMMCSPVLAQDKSKADSANETAENEASSVVIVKGFRKSLATAADKKRKAAQITDRIEAEDVGKLPDNNVVEALAHVTGIQITRERGEGGSVLIRGQSDIQTTINGNVANSGVGRSASLNDISAELIKSITVYKTRTADQVEGGIAGTVNVELRRPLDMKKGWTLAGSVRKVFGSIGETESPYFSALASRRFDTARGEMGFLVNVSYMENNYNEMWLDSETPARFWDVQLASIPVARRDDTFGVYRAQYGKESGKVRRPAINASYQWRVNDNLDFLLEGSSLKSKESRMLDTLNVRVKDGPQVLSNLVYQPDGQTLKSFTLTDPNLTDTNILPMGPFARDDRLENVNNRINFVAHWQKDKLDINANVYKDTNRSDMNWYQQVLRLDGLSSVNVDLNSSKVPTGGPYFEFIGTNLGDVSKYTVNEIENGKSYEDSEETVFQIDLNYTLSEDKLLRSIKVGGRYADRDVQRAYGYRYARFTGARTVHLTDFPGGRDYATINVEVPGFTSPSWYRLSRDSYRDNFDAIRAYAVANQSGGGGSGSWADPDVKSEQLTSTFSSNEKNKAVYAQVNYGFDLGQYPVDGIIGVRSVTTEGTSTTSNFNAVLNTFPTVVRKGSGTDVMPNANAVIHFTKKLQLRLAYTLNIERPSFQDSSSFVFYDTNCKCGWGGNPELKPNEETNYDASLEYYFGRGGVVSFAAYLKKPDGFIAWGADNISYDDDQNPATPNLTYRIDRPQNQGPGEYQGYEFNASGFFDFLPGAWKNLGGQFNMTYNAKGIIKYKYLVEDPDEFPGKYDAPFNSKLTYNLALYYETSKISARVAYNYRDPYRHGRDYATPQYSRWTNATSRLDAAFNYTPNKHVTFSIEGTNLLEDQNKVVYGKENLLPQGVRVPSRTVQVSSRFRF